MRGEAGEPGFIVRGLRRGKQRGRGAVEEEPSRTGESQRPSAEFILSNSEGLRAGRGTGEVVRPEAGGTCAQLRLTHPMLELDCLWSILMTGPAREPLACIPYRAS
jgi:hypothetical protein